MQWLVLGKLTSYTKFQDNDIDSRRKEWHNKIDFYDLRMGLIVESHAARYNRDEFNDILTRHNLIGKWERYYGESNS